MTTLLIGLLIPLLGTMLGASFVFFHPSGIPLPARHALSTGFRRWRDDVRGVGFALGFVLMMVLDVVMG